MNLQGLLVLCIGALPTIIASENDIKEDVREKAAIVKENKELWGSLNHQLRWLEPAASSFFSKIGKEDSEEKREGRFLKLVPVGSSVVKQIDLLFNVLTKALKDLADICELVADKFERFVDEDEENLLEIQLGTSRLNAILDNFEATAISQATAAVAEILSASGGGTVTGGGGLGSVVPTSGLSNLVQGLLGGLGLGKK